MFDFIKKQELWDALDGGLLEDIQGKLTFQLKTIQDLWVYSEIKNERGKKIAEIGGGESRILPRLALNNECYNIEKFEGADHGPESEVRIPGVTNIKTFVGDFSPELEDNSFDVLFSVSVAEHVKDEDFDAFFKDCIRILKPGGYMVHAIDMYIAEQPTVFWKDRYEMYRNAVSTTQGVEPYGGVRPGPLSFSTDMASNPDNIMHGWKSLSPALNELRQNAQSVSVKLGAKKSLHFTAKTSILAPNTSSKTLGSSGIVNSAHGEMPQILENLPYNILSNLPAGLCLDIGAAAGFASILMKKASPDSKTILFEPFEGNIPHLLDVMKDQTKWKHVPKAVSNFSGDAAFFVSSVVKGDEKKWSKRAGYSSVGFLVPVEEVENFDANKTHTVSVCQVDEYVDEPVLFMKIDVQGTEFEVLDGAKNTIKNHGVKLIHTEFTGDIRLLKFLNEAGYKIFDTEHMMIALRNDPTPEGLGMINHTISALSTGQGALTGTILNRPSDFEGYCAFMQATIEKYGFFHTDLFCIHDSFMDEFLAAMPKA